MSAPEQSAGAPSPKAPRQPIRDAATLIVIDRSGTKPKVLMGRRHEGVRFMPGKFVFPGGRVEAADGRVNIAGAYTEHVERRLMERVRRPSFTRARAYGLAAIRELAEETGLLLGDPDCGPFTAAGESWRPFAEAGVFPSLEGLWLIARAITPPKRPRRFDTRFFAADAALIAHRIEGVVSPDAELVELVWTSLDDARELDLPAITRMVLDDLAKRLEIGLESDAPAPFYRQGSASERELI
ncbi:NUDIX hydrolase [Methylopila sp. M107]|uniref:NUDIX hydrolase n=1 Tax=Methylopila sp. M107 TaxID=1101190 RepID=UPI0003666FA4|nr:NUDIX hydrolase [Methylopila sp. M107]